jgi:hypothetical protein
MLDGQCVVGPDDYCCCCAFCDGATPNQWQIDISGTSHFDGTYVVTRVANVSGICQWSLTISVVACGSTLIDISIFLGPTTILVDVSRAAGLFNRWRIDAAAPHDCATSHSPSPTNPLAGPCNVAGSTCTITPL